VKIQLLSDLHLESQPEFLPQQLPRPAQGADLLVLAGDIGSYQTGSKLSDSDFGLAQFSPLHGWPTPVVFVPGNHEYDGLDFDAAHERLRATCARLQIGWLEREVMLGPWTDRQGLPVRLLGTTLWTDFDALGPSADAPAKVRTGGPSAGENLLAQQLKAREKAFRAANFYLKKASTTRHSAPFLAAEIRDQALQCQHWLRQALDTPFEGSTVVVTHFAPSLRSADPRYGLVPGTAGFCSALDDLLPQAQLWLHGHLHAPQDYMHQGCRVVANPLGYARKNEQAFFQPSTCIEI
jgi:predicted phosphodiesterase